MRHVLEKDKSKHAKKRARPNKLVPFNLFVTPADMPAIKMMAREQGFPSRAEMFRSWIKRELEAHAAAKASR